MLSLGIPIDFDNAGNTIVDLNIGGVVKAKDFPLDWDFQLLAFCPNEKRANVVWIDELTKDIAVALATIDQNWTKKGRKPNWYRRLALCASRCESKTHLD